MLSFGLVGVACPVARFFFFNLPRDFIYICVVLARRLRSVRVTINTWSWYEERTLAVFSLSLCDTLIIWSRPQSRTGTHISNIDLTKRQKNKNPTARPVTPFTLLYCCTIYPATYTIYAEYQVSVYLVCYQKMTPSPWQVEALMTQRVHTMIPYRIFLPKY